MRSALLAVDGVTRVQVTLENGETIVTYDPSKATVQKMIAAVTAADGPFPYTAGVKEASGASAR